MPSLSAPVEASPGRVFGWPPEGAGDFADVAWVVAEALGNGSGVRGLDVTLWPSGVSLHVYTTGPEYVRSMAAGFGWELYEPDATYATSYGQLGKVRVNIVWIAPRPDDPDSTSTGCG